jgi:hypothetical protein
MSTLVEENRPSSLFGSEFDPDEITFYNELNEQSGRKSSLSLPEFGDEENIDNKFKSFVDKESTILKDLNGNLFNFDQVNNLYDQYYQKSMDINALWPLLRGNKIRSLKIHNSRGFFDILPFRFNLTDTKHQLDKSILNCKKYEPKPNLYFQSISEYYKWIQNFCDKNCEVIPFKFSNQKIVFLPIISPLWFMNGKTFNKVENYGYINPSSEHSYGWLSDWLTKYNHDIKQKYINANTTFLQRESFISNSVEEEEYKKKLISSALSLTEQPKFKNKWVEDLTFRKKNINYLKKVIQFSETLCKSNIKDFDVLNNVVNSYIEIIDYEIEF